jgi:hypothetical protein
LNSNGKLINFSTNGSECGRNDMIHVSKKAIDKLFLEHVNLSIKRYKDLLEKFPDKFGSKDNDALNYYLQTLGEIMK